MVLVELQLELAEVVVLVLRRVRLVHPLVRVVFVVVLVWSQVALVVVVVVVLVVVEQLLVLMRLELEQVQPLRFELDCL